MKTTWLLLPLFIGIATSLGYVVVSMPEAEPGLQLQVTEQLKVSGVSNPVTAVLLNFRAYDTLLEMAVLLLAVLGVWSLRGRPLQAGFAAGPVLENFTFLLMPLLVLVAGYLLWAGAHAPGGAFQAGAILSSASVLLILSGWQAPRLHLQLSVRLLLCCGIAAFCLVILAGFWRGDALLQLPPDYASAIIIFIESAATLAIGTTLSLLFIGSAPTGDAKTA